MRYPLIISTSMYTADVKSISRERERERGGTCCVVHMSIGRFNYHTPERERGGGERERKELDSNTDAAMIRTSGQTLH